MPIKKLGLYWGKLSMNNRLKLVHLFSGTEWKHNGYNKYLT